MGFDKARAPWRGWPMAVQVLERLAGVAGRVAVVRRGPPDGLPWLRPNGAAVSVLREPDREDRHPLWGVHTALQHAETETVLIVPCDVPRVAPELLAALVGCAPAVAESEGRVHPLVGAFPRSWAARAKELAGSNGSVRAFAADAARVPGSPEGLLNVNAPSDLPPSSLPSLLATLPDASRAWEAESARQRARGILSP